MAKWNRLRNILKKFGPGFVTGVADDDPVSVTTYSIAGAVYGYALNWINVFLTPAMIVIQEMCGRIGMLTGMGLAGTMRRYRSKKLMWFAIGLLFVSNTINIGADLGIMAASLTMVFGLPVYFWLLLLAVIIILMEVLVSYKKYVVYLKWLGLSLLAYVATALIVKQDWAAILRSSFIPEIRLDMNYLMMMVAFLGAIISPYLFFWQTSEEVEEEINEKIIKDFDQDPENEVGIKRIRAMRWDTVLGMVFSNLIGFFVLITTAATLHKNGIIDVESLQEVALALRPIAGNEAYLLLALGIVGIGLVSIPVLAGCVGYAVADGLDIEEGLSKKYHQAKGFYRVLILATVLGFLMNLLGVNPIKGLYYSAILNGVISVPLIAMIISLADDKKVVGRYRTPWFGRIIAWVTFGFMSLAVMLMVASFLGFSF
jgi:NRAMP (natural resistance-associated macrophage protein)-like metal ion transporter